MPRATVLILMEDRKQAATFGGMLEAADYRPLFAASVEQAMEAMRREAPVAILADEGEVLCNENPLTRRVPSTPLVVISEHNDAQRAVAALHAGASDYLSMPVAPELLLERLSRFVPPPQDLSGCAIVAEDLRTREMLTLAHRVAQTSATVLISGESGTGKEVFARYIHRHSGCAEGPFVAINCAAIPENMLESVLFGHEKGAFTGAYHASPGKFEQAQGGTLLLDEISEMSLDLQAKLLRVLQEREVERLGGRTVIPLDVRVLATTNRNLREEVAAGRFREDLFYRLNVFPLALPPLRERKRDLMPLAKHLIAKHTPAGRAIPQLAKDAERALLEYPWPGNIRELDNLIQRAMILSQVAVIRAADLMFEAVDGAPACSVSEEPRRLAEDLKGMEEQMILDALTAGNGSRKQAAEQLGISPRTLRYKIARLREAGVAVP
ncbi:MAG TPA: sigma-54-dependent Fis family transcriptional regulator [Chromatiales bacterium]|nr:sigma-54-dependent Fis family transcriptional regulator [Chromatiales bacterium]